MTDEKKETLEAKQREWLDLYNDIKLVHQGGIGNTLGDAKKWKAITRKDSFKRLFEGFAETGLSAEKVDIWIKSPDGGNWPTFTEDYREWMAFDRRIRFHSMPNPSVSRSGSRDSDYHRNHNHNRINPRRNDKEERDSSENSNRLKRRSRGKSWSRSPSKSKNRSVSRSRSRHKHWRKNRNNKNKQNNQNKERENKRKTSIYKKDINNNDLNLSPNLAQTPNFGDDDDNHDSGDDLPSHHVIDDIESERKKNENKKGKQTLTDAVSVYLHDLLLSSGASAATLKQHIAILCGKDKFEIGLIKKIPTIASDCEWLEYSMILIDAFFNYNKKYSSLAPNALNSIESEANYIINQSRLKKVKIKSINSTIHSMLNMKFAPLRFAEILEQQLNDLQSTITHSLPADHTYPEDEICIAFNVSYCKKGDKCPQKHCCWKSQCPRYQSHGHINCPHIEPWIKNRFKSNNNNTSSSSSSNNNPRPWNNNRNRRNYNYYNPNNHNNRNNNNQYRPNRQ